MPRVFHVTLTKQMDFNILADDECELEDELVALSNEIDREWNPPDWEVDVHDPLAHIKTSEKLPKQISKIDMVMIEDQIYCHYEGGDIQKDIDEMETEAQKELDDLRMSLGVKETTSSLPGVK
jgi:hypothetical protein